MKPFDKYYTNYCIYREKDVDSEYINALKNSLSKLIIDYKLKDFLSNQLKMEVSNKNNIE